MSEVSKIQGPGGSSEQPGKKDDKSVDADKFKQAMRRRVEEVSQVDPDEQKKRKRREESEEDIPTSSQTIPPPPTPFSLEEEKGKKKDPLQIEKTGRSSHLTRRGSLSSHQTPSSSTLHTDPSNSFNSEEDMSIHQEETFTHSYGPEDSFPSSQNAPLSPQTQSEKHPTPLKKESIRSKKSLPLSSPPHPDLSKSTVASPSRKKKEDTSGLYRQFKKEGVAPLQKEKAEPLEEESLFSPPPPPSTSPQIDRSNEKKGPAGIEELTTMGTPIEPLVPSPEIETPSPSPAYARLPPQVMDLFDRMVGAMTVMDVSGIQETTITLNAPQFASSVFFGSQLIIQEFSTAPKVFNIQFNGSTEAIRLFQGRANDLMAAFQQGNFNFRINRLQTGYLEEKPLFKRKKKTSGEEKNPG